MAPANAPPWRRMGPPDGRRYFEAPPLIRRSAKPAKAAGAVGGRVHSRCCRCRRCCAEPDLEINAVRPQWDDGFVARSSLGTTDDLRNWAREASHARPSSAPLPHGHQKGQRGITAHFGGRHLPVAGREPQWDPNIVMEADGTCFRTNAAGVAWEDSLYDSVDVQPMASRGLPPGKKPPAGSARAVAAAFAKAAAEHAEVAKDRQRRQALHDGPCACSVCRKLDAEEAAAARKAASCTAAAAAIVATTDAHGPAAPLLPGAIRRSASASAGLRPPAAWWSRGGWRDDACDEH